LGPDLLFLMGFLGIGNNPMVACAVDVAAALNK
jgi:hypothetical protein